LDPDLRNALLILGLILCGLFAAGRIGAQRNPPDD
jgi:hypothetical protein